MPCIETRNSRRREGLGVTATVLLAGWLSGCSSSGDSPRAPVAVPIASPPAPGPVAAAPQPPTAAPTPQALPAPRAARSWIDVRQQAAERLVAANPERTYTGAVPEALLAIPVLEVELNGDGSVRRIVVLREPRQAKDTIAIATSAIHRAAPFGDVSRLPRPWKFVETFLFDDERRFKPRTLDR